MDLLQLRYFCDAARTENFSETAAKHLVPPSNISQTVSRLERELGTKLFDREKNSVRLNGRGAEFYREVSRALSIIDSACRAAKDSTDTCLEIKLVVSSNRRIVTRAIELFREKNPDVSFNISHRREDIDDTTDIVISDDVTLKSNYSFEPLVEENILLAVASSSPIAKLTHVGREELSKERFIFLNEGSSLSRVASDVLAELGVEPNVVIRVDDPYYLRKYVTLGLGIALVPEISFLGGWDGDVTMLKLGDYRRTTYLFTKRDCYVSLAAREFSSELLRLAQEEMSNLPR